MPGIGIMYEIGKKGERQKKWEKMASGKIWLEERNGQRKVVASGKKLLIGKKLREEKKGEQENKSTDKK